MQQVTSPAQVRHLIGRAIRIAVGDRRVTAIVPPSDLQEETYRDPPRKHGTLRSGVWTPFSRMLARGIGGPGLSRATINLLLRLVGPL